jgi:hypothetical protein
MSEVRAPMPGLMHTGEEAKPPFAVPSHGFAECLPFRLRALALARNALPMLPMRDALRRGRRDGLPIGLVTTVGT